MSVWRSSRGVRTLVWIAPLVVALGMALAGCKSVQQARPAATQPPGVTGPVITTPGVVPPPSQAEAPPLPPVTPSEPNAPAAPGQPVRVALLLPLTGPYANFGRALLDAATLALFDLGDDRLVMLPRDTQSTPSGAQAAAQAALNDGAQIVLGPLLSAETATVAPLFRERGLNVISFSSDRSVAGSGVYIMGFTPGQEVSAVVDYAHAQGLNRFAVLAPESPYGNAVRDALQAALSKVGGELVKAESYPPDSADLTAIVRRFAERDRRAAALAEQRRMLEQKDDDASREALKRLEGQTALGDTSFDALLLPEGGARLKALAPLLAYYDVDPGKVRFLGTGLWDDPGLGNEPNLVGGWFAAAPPNNVAAFRERFEKSYGRIPPRIASLAYDAMALTAVLAKAETGANFGRDALTNPNGFSGYDGIFRFSADGVAQRGLAVLEVAPRQSKVARPAPETFENVSQ